MIISITLWQAGMNIEIAPFPGATLEVDGLYKSSKKRWAGASSLEKESG